MQREVVEIFELTMTSGQFMSSAFNVLLANLLDPTVILRLRSYLT
jgi:hypothetical protein